LLVDLGVGVMWFRRLAAWITDAADLIDVVEVEPPTQWAPRPDGSVTVDEQDIQALIRLGKPILVHGVTCPVGGTRPADERDRDIFVNAADQFSSPWASEHLSINRLGSPQGNDVDAGFLLPPLQTEEVVITAAERLRSLQRELGRPIAFETGVNYLQPREGELRDGAFFAAVAEAADCSIVCDLHNLWCNERNGRDNALDVVASLPLERICEVHVAGGQEYGRYYLDAHSGLLDDRLYALAAEVVPQLPALRALIFELMPDYVAPSGITLPQYREQLRTLRDLWDSRGSTAHETGGRVGVAPRPTADRALAPTIAPVAYEEGLLHALKPTMSGAAALPWLVNDEGIAVYRHLINRVRLGNLVTVLPLSYRLLVSVVGVDASDSLLEEYERCTETQGWALVEAKQFLAYARRSSWCVPHLTEVMEFELAAHQSALDRSPVTVDFTCDPGPLLEALRRGRPVPRLAAATYRVVVDPSAIW
jgi:uncharacterized protein